MNQSDSADELRKKLLALTYVCPKGEYLSQCPFALLGGLSHASRQDLLQRMDREALERLFALLPGCSCPGDPRNGPVSN